jgi:hypothetical protein
MPRSEPTEHVDADFCNIKLGDMVAPGAAVVSGS